MRTLLPIKSWSKRGDVLVGDFTPGEIFWGVLILLALYEIWFSWLKARGIDIEHIIESMGLGNLHDWWVLILPYLKIFSRFLTIVFIFGITYSVFEANKINKKMDEELYPDTKEESLDKSVNRKWTRVIKYMESTNTADWQLAILEADIMLDELLETSGYHGDTMSDKLKQVDKSDFNTIDLAWDAHKVRNMIAHEGADFVLTEREARRVMELYRQVFKEFDYI